MLLSTVDSCDVNLTGLCRSTNLYVCNHTEISRTVHHANLFVNKSIIYDCSDYPIKNYSCINKSAYIYNNYTTNSSILCTLFCPNTDIIVPIWTLLECTADTSSFHNVCIYPIIHKFKRLFY